MNLDTALTEIATRLDTITGLRCYAFPPDVYSPPAAIVGYPDSYTYDATYRRGKDQMTVPVWVVVGRVSDRASRTELAAYCDGSGDRSIKTVLESGTYTAIGALRVSDVEFDSLTIAAVEHVAAKFNIDISGQGA